MEGRYSNILLITFASFALHATSAFGEEPVIDSDALTPVIEPEVKRTRFEESKILSTDFEIIASAGLLSTEDFGTNAVIAVKLNYHVSDKFFLGAELAKSKGGKTSAETLNGNLSILSDDERNIVYYSLSAGYNVFPGESFLSENTTYNTAFYVFGGLGSTDFAGDTQFTSSIGMGYKILISNYFTLYSEMRDNIFRLDILGEDKLTHNLQLTVGLGYYF